MLIAHKEILVVEDEREFSALIHKKLKAAGYQTVMAHNGEEALVALWEKHGIGLVLLDVRLPFINGLNIFEIIRKDFPDKRIIVSSALQKDEQKFIISQADDYYYKGEDLDILIEKVNMVLNNKSLIGTLGENDKRNSRRIPVNIFASCESANHRAPHTCAHFFSYTKDLSLKGGRFIVGEDIKVGQHFSAALELPANFMPLLIDCEVMWNRKLEESDPKAKGSNEIGVRFVRLDLPHDEEELKNYFNFI